MASGGQNSSSGGQKGLNSGHWWSKFQHYQHVLKAVMTAFNNNNNSCFNQYDHRDHHLKVTTRERKNNNINERRL